MRRLIGYTLFWTAKGILIGILIENLFFGILLTFLFILLGYNLFMC